MDQVCNQFLSDDLDGGIDAGLTYLDRLLQDEDRQHDPVQRKEETLEEDQAEAVDQPCGFYLVGIEKLQPTPWLLSWIGNYSCLQSIFC